MKKGFTLVELLAIIIILGIILLIAIPSINGIIIDSKKSALATSAITAGTEAERKISIDYAKGIKSMPIEGESTTMDITSFKNKKFNKYDGVVTITNTDGDLTYKVSITDGIYYICNIDYLDLDSSYVSTNNECDTSFASNDTDNSGEDNENEEDENVDGINVNSPILATGMTPVKWVGSELTVTTSDDSEWFDYSEENKKWANAMTADGSLWVWIPRYAYKISSGYHTNTAGIIEVKFLKGLTNVAYDGTIATAVDHGNNPGSDIQYVTHQAFKFGNEDIKGIWVMKFEASASNGRIASKPNVASWRSQTVGNMFTLSRVMELDDTYGWGTTGDNIDTHMLKDVEWGAATYLAWSAYGKNSEIWINNSSAYITGCAGSSVAVSNYNGCQNQYNTVKGQNASTTGNYYGIYDMSGGAYEHTASYLSGGTSNLTKYGASLIGADDKYVNIYSGDSDYKQTNYDLNTKFYGNAMYETSSTGNNSTSWNNDQSEFLTLSWTFSIRGGVHSTATSAGSFVFAGNTGNVNSYYSWRVATVVQAGM